ncbi:MAG: nucleotide exchange factor GrpE [Candidatus ainarchaeum sp.]|nr:nucleotide exchange factor GrpE [Candidatus ainarchaeum sp.]
MHEKNNSIDQTQLNSKENNHQQNENLNKTINQENKTGPTKPVENKPIIDQDKQRIIDLTESLKRLQAEFENYQKRTEKQNQEYKEFASANLIEQLLPVIDSLEQGIKHTKEFMPVYEQLNSILKKNGLEKINVCVGDEFNHETMECLMQESNKNLGDGVVAQVLSNGYILKGKILRHTKISINKLENNN